MSPSPLFETDHEAEALVQEAAQAACAVLDARFPGYDAGGVTSNFRGLLEDVLKCMLQGIAPRLPGRSGTQLPQLVLGDSFFGAATQGPAFVVQLEETHGQPRYLTPDGYTNSLEAVGDAWTTRQAAIQAAIHHFREEAWTRAELAALPVQIVPVILDPDRELGALPAAEIRSRLQRGAAEAV